MKPKVAVATVQGKTYFLVVNALQEKGIPFVSLVPGETAPLEVKAVVTTEPEKAKVNFEKILIYKNQEELPKLITEVNQILQGKRRFKKLVFGIDPGKVFGVAVAANGKVIYRENCFSVQEVVNWVKEVLSVNLGVREILVKIGNGVPIYKELLDALDASLPKNVVLEIVDEAGTNLPLIHNKRSRRIRHITSAIKISGRTGTIHPRRGADVD
jgi:hypothetical protein